MDTAENVVAVGDQDIGMEQTTGKQVMEGIGMCDSVQEVALLLESSTVRADDNIVSENKSVVPDTSENVVASGNLLEEKMDEKRKKSDKMKQDVSVASNLKSSSEIKGENLASQTQIYRIEQSAGNQAVEGTEMRDGVQLLKSSPVETDDNNISEDKSTVQGSTENVVILGDLLEKKKNKKRKRSHWKKKSISVAVNPEQNLETEGENLAIQTQNNRMVQTSGNQVIEGIGMCDSMQAGALLLESSTVRADDNIVSEDKSVVRDTSGNVVASSNLDKKKKKKDKKRKKNDKMKQDVSVASNLKNNSEIKGENLASQTQIYRIEQSAGNQAFEGTEVRDGVQLLKNSPVRADDNIISEDKSTVQGTTENVVILGVLNEKKKNKKRKMSRRKKKAISVAVNPEKNLVTEGDNLASQTQYNRMEQTSGNQVIKGIGMCDNMQAGALLLESSTVRADNVVSEDKSIVRDTSETVVASGNLHEEKKNKKRKKRGKMKQDASVAANLKNISEIEGKNFASQTQISRIEQTAGNQAFEVTEVHDGGLLLKSSPVGADENITSEEHVVILGDLLEAKKDKKWKRRQRKKKAISVAVNPEQNPETEGENLASQTQNNRIEQAMRSQASEGTEIHDCAQEGVLLFKTVADDGNLMESAKETDEMQADEMQGTTSSEDRLKLGKLKENEVHANNAGSLADIAADQEMQTSKSQSLKEMKKMNTKSANSHLEELKEGERSANQIAEVASIRGTDIALSVEGIISLADESTHKVINKISGDKPESMTDIENKDDQRLKGMALDMDIVKPPQDTARDQNVTEELVVSDSHAPSIKFNQESWSPQKQFTAHLGENVCRIETALDKKKNDVCADHVGNASEVAVSDTKSPDTCKKKKEKKRRLSSVSQLELNDEDGAKDTTKESSSVNDTESKQSREGNNLAPGEDIPKRALLSSNPVKDACGPDSNGEVIHEKILLLYPERNSGRSPGRKLLILDINGLLADIVAPVRPGYKPDIMVSQKAVFKRPFCDSFLQFCFEKFDVGVWSSRVKKNVDKVLDFLLGEMKNKLIFYWDRSHCTITGFPTVENRDKPLVLKELRKLWDDHQFHFGKYDQSNTLLLDDSPYKALLNPADTAIFPASYQYTDVDDCSLGPGGDLRVYLERLAMADNIPEYVRNNPFGQRPIRETNLSWKYYKKVLDSRLHDKTYNG